MSTLIIRIIALVLGILFCSASAAHAAERTERETMSCVASGFTAAPFTGSLTEKLEQARHMDTGTLVLVEDVWTPLPQGSSLYAECKRWEPAPVAQPPAVAESTANNLNTKTDVETERMPDLVAYMLLGILSSGALLLYVLRNSRRKRATEFPIVLRGHQKLPHFEGSDAFRGGPPKRVITTDPDP